MHPKSPAERRRLGDVHRLDVERVDPRTLTIHPYVQRMLPAWTVLADEQEEFDRSVFNRGVMISDNYFCRSTTTTFAGPDVVLTARAKLPS